MFNFKSGTALAVQQDAYIQVYKSGGQLSLAQIADIESNAWVALAFRLAPSNLVIRQYALIDLFTGSTTHKDQILYLMDLLSYKAIGDHRVWGEGYTYFKYVMDVLQEWLTKYNDQIDLAPISMIVREINAGFLYTAYIRNGMWWPAPLGDVREVPLDPQPQPVGHPLGSLTVSNVEFHYDGSTDKIVYYIKGAPIGLNTHIPVNDYTVRIINNYPVGFTFYQGYDKKYKNSWAEFLDTYSIKRIMSIPV